MRVHVRFTGPKISLLLNQDKKWLSINAWVLTDSVLCRWLQCTFGLQLCQNKAAEGWYNRRSGVGYGLAGIAWTRHLGCPLMVEGIDAALGH